MQDGETIDAKWVTLEKLYEIIEKGKIALPVSERLLPLRYKFNDFLFEIKKSI